jgi:hypothetical protein
MGDRRPTKGQNWRVREAVGIRQQRPHPDYGAYVLERLEDELQQIERQLEKDELQRGRQLVSRPKSASGCYENGRNHGKRCRDGQRFH